METNEKDFTPQESLLVIRSMIETTKHTFSDSSHYFLLWGWATMVACIIQYVLLVVFHSPYHSAAWSLMLLALVVHIIFAVRDKRKEQKVKTFISEATGAVWMIIGFSYFAFSFVFSKIGWEHCFPFYIMLYGIGTFITGKLINFKPLIFGGASCLFLVIITPYLTYHLQILMEALGILISYIIPGHLLRSHYKILNKV